MSQDAVPPLIWFLEELPECDKHIFTANKDDRTLRMLRCLVQSSKSLRDNEALKNVMKDLKLILIMKTNARNILEQHLQTPLADNSVLDEFRATAPGTEMSGFHLLHAIRTLCAAIRCNAAIESDFKKIETNMYIEGIIQRGDGVQLLADMLKYAFSPSNAVYLFECVEFAQNNHKFHEFQATHAPNRAAEMVQYRESQRRHVEMCHHLTATGVYAAMFAVCLANVRNRTLINNFMEIVDSVPSTQSSHNKALVSIFEKPGNLVKFQTLIYDVCQSPCTMGDLTKTYSRYCLLTRRIFDCVEYENLVFSDSEQFEASKLMICNLERMADARDDDYWQYRVQYAICKYMSMDTIAQLYEAGYIQRLADTGAEGQGIFRELAARWNAMPDNMNQWTLPDPVLPYAKFMGLAPAAL